MQNRPPIVSNKGAARWHHQTRTILNARVPGIIRREKTTDPIEVQIKAWRTVFYSLSARTQNQGRSFQVSGAAAVQGKPV